MRKAALFLAVLACGTLCAQNNQGEATGSVNAVFDKYQQPDVSLEVYFTPSKGKATPDEKGFIRRWSLLEPISKPEIRSNSIFTDSYLKAEFAKEYFNDQMTVLPKDGDKVTVSIAKPTRQMGRPGVPQGPQQGAPQAQPAQPEYQDVTLTWHCFDSKRYNVKLYRFATGLGLRPTECLFLAVTVINAPQDMTVRLAAGSNSASMWWVNGKEVLLLSGDRRMVVDDCVSGLITLKKGKNIVRGAVINGPGMSDFCVRFLDESGKPVTNLTVSNK